MFGCDGQGKAFSLIRQFNIKETNNNDNFVSIWYRLISYAVTYHVIQLLLLIAMYLKVKLLVYTKSLKNALQVAIQRFALYYNKYSTSFKRTE